MKHEIIRFWNSIVTRFALFFTGLNILAILIAGYLVYQLAAEVIITYSQDRMRYTSNLASQAFYSLLNEVANDIAVISNNPVLNNYINAASPDRLHDLQDLFSVILANKAHYFQIRLLDINNRGKEILRYEKMGEVVTRTPEDELQFKGDRNYYQEAVTTPRASYYYSDINLNEEFGAVSYPLTPTLRAVGQVFDHQGDLVALLVINVNLSGFYHQLKQIMESATQLMLINEEGEYLFAPDPDKRFGQQLNHNHTFGNDFDINISQLVTNIDDYQFIQDQSGNSFLYHMVPLPYSKGQKIYLVNLLEDNLLFKSAHLVRNDSLKIVGLICLIATIVVFLFTRISSRRINQITQAISAYEEGNTSEGSRLPENRKDEIGILARSFSRMRQRIDRQLTDLKAAVSREQKAIRERDEFLQNMSHEIRTPLNTILGLSQLLSKNNPRDDQQPIIDSLRRSTWNLSGLMSDILDHNKLIEGKLYIEHSPQNIFELLSDIHAGYQYEAINQGLIFKLSIADQLKSARYLTDPLRLSQIVTNLVVNAIKYTDKGTVELKAKPLKEDPPMLELIVTDTGKGISADNLKNIQERFYREKEVILTKAEGFGLGLSIVTQLVELFGGKLEVTSQRNQGSQFKVLLPLLKVKSAEKLSDPSDNDTALPQLRGTYRVLHIEDDPSTLLMVSHILNKDQIILDQARNMDEAIKFIEAHPPNLILSDLMLENDLIHSHLIQIIKKLNTPLIVLSAFANPEMEELGSYFLQKPFDVDHLSDLVIAILGRSEYDEPQLEATYDQYDRDQVKIRKFLSIVLSEFGSYSQRFEKVFETRDAKEWKAIIHKLTTHIKNFQLQKLMRDLPSHPDQFDRRQLVLVRNHLLYCLCIFRIESRINSAG